LLAHRAKAGVDLAAVGVRGNAVEHAARAELRAESGVLGAVRVLRFFFGVEVVEIPVRLVGPVHGR
jgi:hypothetical protein